jgi:pyruvate dehydrogenase E2 component (dihydrolipoamide acetyltransferase)
MSAKHTITLPDIGDYKDVPVVELLVKPGDTIKIDDLLLTIESDKATIEVPSPVAGTVLRYLVDVSSTVSQGSALMEIELHEQAIEDTSISAPPTPAIPAPPSSESTRPIPHSTPARTSEQPVATPVSGTLSHASPSVRQYARELGVDLQRVQATGPKDRILKDDVRAFVKNALSGVSAPPGLSFSSGLPDWPSIDFSRYGEIDRIPLSRIQKIAGGNLARNWLMIPHVTNFDHADITELEGFRKDVNAEKRDPMIKLTMVAFLIKASASALKAYPKFNSSLDGDTLVFKKYVHIGFAADTPNGLVVPVIRDADKKGIFQIAAEMFELAGKARDGKLPGADMQGGTFTVSSLGGVGGDGFTPIINAPEVAILGAGRASTQPIWDDTSFVPRLIVPISLSWDHRVVDGVAAARFLGHISTVLGDFRRALL